MMDGVRACWAAIDWGQRWFRAVEGPVLIHTHRACGQGLRIRVTCDGCAAPLRGNDIIVERDG